MNIPDKVQKVIDANIIFFNEKEKVFDSIGGNSVEDLLLKEKEYKATDKIMWSISLDVACNHIPFAWRKDFELGYRITKKMKAEIKSMRVEKMNGNLI
jgi:hypothetical protein